MATVLNLRQYQRESVDSIFRHYLEHDGAPLVVLPTGSGKSLVMAAFIQEVMAHTPDVNILVLAHVKELLEQNYKEIKALWKNAPVGIYSAGIGRREMFDFYTRIVFAGIQSIWNKAYDLQRVDIVIVDEAHMIPRKSSTRYFSFLSDLRKINSRLVLLGLTATPYRLDSGLLVEGEDALFSRICYEANVADLVDQGYLSPLTSKRTSLRVDLSTVQTRGGEFIQGQMAKAMEAGDNNTAAIEEIIEWGEDRRSWLLFCAGIDHTEHIYLELVERGVSAAYITGKTPKGERDTIIRDYKAGRIRALVNCDVLTTGFNAPAVDLIAFLRATQSVSLYVQMAGRGTRNAPGKNDCLVLDFAGNVERHGPIDAITVKSQADKGGVFLPGGMPSKSCPQCRSIWGIQARTCKTCGWEFPEPEQTQFIAGKASQLPIMSREVSEMEVLYFFVNPYHKPGKPLSIKIDYYTSERCFPQWVCVEYSGFARHKAEQWWRRVGLPGACPPTASAAISAIRDSGWRPKFIKVQRRDRYWDVINVKGELGTQKEAVG